MAFILDPDAILAAITSTAAGITGIRAAYDYDAWPDAPPALHGDGSALHLTGVPGEDGTGWTYGLGGPDLAVWTLRVPLYTVVADSARTSRARSWALTYASRYVEAFRGALHLSGTITAGSVGFDEETRIVRSLGDDWPGYDGFYIVRHVLTVTTKGAVSNAL